MAEQPETRRPVVTPSEATGGATENIGIKDLFFLRRLPKLRYPRDYERPSDPAKYREALVKRGFITVEDIQRHNKDNALPDGALKRLRTEVLYMLNDPVSQIADASYIERLSQFDHDAGYYQNIYYWYNWVFIVGAFVTTLMSLIGVISPRFDPSGATAGVAWAITAVFGVITAVATALNQSRRPQLRWYINRRKAEAMRRHYYLYMMRAEPYSGDPAARRAKLAEVINQVENIGSSLTDESQRAAVVVAEATPVPVAERMNGQELDFLTYIYRERRLQAQTTWYRNRVQEYEYNSNNALLLSAVFVSAVGPVGALSAQLQDNFLFQLLPTALPALAAALAAFHQVYGWDRQRRVYEDTVAQLRGASAKLDKGEGTERKSNFLDTVQLCEGVFASESDQWGQGLIDQELATLDAQTAGGQFEALLNRANLPEDKRQEVMKILNSVPDLTRPGSASPPSA